MAPKPRHAYILVQLQPQVGNDDITHEDVRIVFLQYCTPTAHIIPTIDEVSEDCGSLPPLEDDFGYGADVPSSESDFIVHEPHDPEDEILSESVSADADSLLTELFQPFQSSHSSLSLDRSESMEFTPIVEYIDVYGKLIAGKDELTILFIKKMITREISESLYTEIYRGFKKAGLRIELPSIERLKRRIISLIKVISKEVNDVTIPKIRGDPTTISFNYRWYTLYKFPLPQGLKVIRDKLHIAGWQLRDFPQFNTVDEYIDYCIA
ncbi:hypothetical protein ADUPG1_006083, partial [Aduncisulcus paluster]